MKIKEIRIENFRSFKEETVSLNRYCCFVGPNGAGKSNVLSALNVFFREQGASATDVTKLTEEDYFNKDTSQPVRITVIFDDLNESAQAELKDYFRQGQLVVTAEAKYAPDAACGVVKHFGQRLGMEAFRRFFEQDKAGAKVAELNPIFDELRGQFPELPAARSKDDKAAALRDYEATHPDQCVLIQSEDNFYGVNSTGKLAGFVQWVCVPAVKDAGEETQEAKNTALGKLVARAVRNKVNFDDDIAALRDEALEKYRAVLERNQAGLSEISAALRGRLAQWSHPDVRLGVEWLSDPAKAVQVTPPVAGIKTGEGDFLGSLARMGHGLQRSYWLALLQELAGADSPDAPTLLLGCEEPELYQHPPQARYLADVLRELSKGNNQVIITTHSPFFVSGEGFEDIRVVRRPGPRSPSGCRGLTLEKLCARIRTAKRDGRELRRVTGLVAKIHQTLQPQIAEMFFCRIPVLVEGLEDVGYITTQLHISGQWDEFRRLGCHLVPAGGKDKLIQPLAIAVELRLPAYTVFDADGNCRSGDQRRRHEADNQALLALLGEPSTPFPAATLQGSSCTVWPSNLTEVVKQDFGGRLDKFKEPVRVNFAQEGDLEKNVLFLAEWLTAASDAGCQSPSLAGLCNSILEFAKKEEPR